MATIKMDTCTVDWSHNFSNNYKQHVYSSKVLMFELSLLYIKFTKAYTIVFILR